MPLTSLIHEIFIINAIRRTTRGVAKLEISEAKARERGGRLWQWQWVAKRGLWPAIETGVFEIEEVVVGAWCQEFTLVWGL